jgi:SAM-dependent methyltransferase
LPARTVLEIAPGFGRWSQYLKELSDHLILVDLVDKCIEKCRERFTASTHISYHVNDGHSLDMLPDLSVDFAFSFDSLVHAEADVIEAYLVALSRKLSPHGIGFVHHSNMGAYPAQLFVGRCLQRLPRRLDRVSSLLTGLRLSEPNSHWRALSVSGALFERLCRKAGLQCTTQELINWGARLPTDCISVFTRPDSRWARPNRVFTNFNFMTEARDVAARYRLYGGYSS